jgi:hypothetical protein
LAAIVDDSDGRETTLTLDFVSRLSVHFSVPQSRLDNSKSYIAHRIRFIRVIRGCPIYLSIYLSIYRLIY